MQNGVWLVNPNILMRGSDKKRQILLSYYQADEPINEVTFQRIKQKEITNKPELDNNLLEGDVIDVEEGTD